MEHISNIQGGDCSFSEFPKLKEKYIQNIDIALQKDIPSLMAKLPGYGNSQGKQGAAAAANPFEEDEAATTGWTVNPEQKASDPPPLNLGY